MGETRVGKKCLYVNDARTTEVLAGENRSYERARRVRGQCCKGSGKEYGNGLEDKKVAPSFEALRACSTIITGPLNKH